MDLIIVRKSTGELLTAAGASYYGQTRTDTVPVRSSVGVTVRFLDDDDLPTLLDPASGVLSFTAQPAAADTFTVGPTTYRAVTALTGAADEVLLGANLAAFIVNLVAAVNGSVNTGANAQSAGTTYGVGTVANPVATAAVYGSAVVFTACYADGSGNTVATTTTSAHASFGAPTLAGADVLTLDIKPTGEYDAANFTVNSPVFTAPLDPSTGDYTGLLSTRSTAALAVLDPNDADGSTPNATEPDEVALMAQLSWGPDENDLARSDEWTLNLRNVVRHSSEGLPLDDPAALTLAQVQTAVVQSVASYTAPAKLYVSPGSPTASDATAARGTRAAYATLARAMGDAQDGDTIVISANNAAPAVLTGAWALSKNLNLVSGSRGRAVVMVDDTTAVTLTGAGLTLTKRNLKFTGAGPATKNAGVLFHLGAGTTAQTQDCIFTNLNQTVYVGDGLQGSTFCQNGFFHVGAAIYSDDSPGVYVKDLTWEGNKVEWTIGNACVFHSINSYNAAHLAGLAADESAQLYSSNWRINRNTVRYAGMGVQASAIGIEVWHGCDGGEFNGNVGEDTYSAFSLDHVVQMQVIGNRARNSSIAYEFNSCVGLTLLGNTLDSRPRLDSPFAGGGNHGTILFDGISHDLHWIGGVIIGSTVTFGTNDGSPVQRCSIQKASLLSSLVFVQHPLGDIDVTDCVYAQANGLPAPGSWLVIDTGGAGTAVGRIGFKRNVLRTGASGYGIDFFPEQGGGALGTVTRLEIEGNDASGAVCLSGQFHVANATCVQAHSYKNNLGVPGNAPLPNDDAGVNFALNGGDTSNQAQARQINSDPSTNGSVHVHAVLTGSPGFAKFTDLATPYVIQPGDNLEYDVWMASANPSFANGFDCNFPDGTYLRDYGVDQNGLNTTRADLSAYAKGRWYHRKLSLSAAAGKSMASLSYFFLGRGRLTTRHLRPVLPARDDYQRGRGFEHPAGQRYHADQHGKLQRRRPPD